MANKPVKNRRKRDGAQNEFKEELIDLARVTRVVKWWRRMRFRATVVVWNEKWKVWLGIWKANEVTIAIKKAIVAAKKNLIIIPIVNWTIDRDVKVKFKWAQILIMPACEGTWVIAWWSVRKIAEVAWIHNILSKRFWSTNKLTNSQAMMKAIGVLANANKSTKKVETDTKWDEENKEGNKEIKIENKDGNKGEDKKEDKKENKDGPSSDDKNTSN